jgi:hypothetical protein
MPSVWFSFTSLYEVSYFDGQLSKYASNPDAVQQLTQFKNELESVRIAIFKSDLLRSLFFMILVGGLIYLLVREKIAKKYFIIILSVLVLVDIWIVDKRYMNNEKVNGEYTHWKKNYQRNNPFVASVADKQILNREINSNPELETKINDAVSKINNSTDFLETEKEKTTFSTLNFSTNYRVFTLQDPFSNASVSYFHKSIGGYHGAKLKRYQELIDFRLSKELQIIYSALESNNDTLIRNTLINKLPTLSMLNTRYIIYNPDAAPLLNPSANGAAWFVSKIQLVNNADEEILSLDTINPKTTLVVDKRFANQVASSVSFDPSATISQTVFMPNHLKYETNASNPQVVAFSEIYYADGWNAYIDGALSPYVRANYVLRAMNIPSGKHTIEFKFEPKSYTMSKNISYAGTGLLILFIIGSVAYGIKKKLPLKK